VKISRPFYLGVYPVTQGEYEKVMGTNPSAFTTRQMEASAFKPPLDPKQIEEREKDVKRIAGKHTSRHPVETVNWEEAMEFCRKLSAMPAERAARRVFRLPTEAEWEYAARGGPLSPFEGGQGDVHIGKHKYAGSNNLDAIGWYEKNAGGKTHPVALKQPNELGLYDMSGNVWEWCQDKWHDNYQGAPTDGSAWETGDSSDRVNRGGSWYYLAQCCRSAYRSFGNPDRRNGDFGFRLVFVP
jgi:formylglycine-generating enzyme required for sulfatase activity